MKYSPPILESGTIDREVDREIDSQGEYALEYEERIWISSLGMWRLLFRHWNMIILQTNTNVSLFSVKNTVEPLNQILQPSKN